METKYPKSGFIIAFLVIATFLVKRYIPDFYAYLIIGKDRFNAMNYTTLLCDLTAILLCFVTTFYLSGFSFKKMLEMMGLDKNPGVAFLLALLAAAPQLIGMLYLHGFRHDVPAMEIWFMGIHPGYNEEFIFRGFLIGLLVRYAKWPAIIPLVLSGALFAWGHLYQADGFKDSIMVFLMAFGVGTGFYMLYKYTGWNLWFPIFLHSFMDTSTVISNWHGTIMMSAQDNIFRGATIGIAILITIRIAWRNAKNKALAGDLGAGSA